MDGITPLTKTANLIRVRSEEGIIKPPVLQKFSFIAIFLVVCQFSYASTPIVHEISVDASAAIEEFRFWENQIKRALEDEELPIYWAERGTDYAIWGRDENAIERSRYLLQKVVEQPEPSAAALYEIAKYCYSEPLENWCLCPVCPLTR